MSKMTTAGSRRPFVRFLIVLSAAGAGLTGCVPQQRLDVVREQNRELEEDIIDLNDRNAELSTMVAELQASLDQSRDYQAQADGKIGELSDQIRAQLENVRRQEDALANLSLSPIDARTELALSSLADRYPDLVTYDAETGRLRFSSDLTFPSGSDSLRAGARDGLTALGRILNEGSARDYDIIVVGHTDSAVPGAATRQRFPTNMHLSVARAISVRGSLVGVGVDPVRVQAAGWGEHRPLIPNNPDGNTAENRRVSIYLVPASTPTTRANASDFGSVPIDRQSAPSRGITPGK